jgi:hypothetical protein
MMGKGEKAHKEREGRYGARRTNLDQFRPNSRARHIYAETQGLALLCC